VGRQTRRQGEHIQEHASRERKIFERSPWHYGIAAGTPTSMRIALSGAEAATFDVIVTENSFGEIISDLAAGSSAAWAWAPRATSAPKPRTFTAGERHGAPGPIAGKGIANPIAAITIPAGLMPRLDWPPAQERRSGGGPAILFERARRGKVLAEGKRSSSIRRNGERRRLASAIANRGGQVAPRDSNPAGSVSDGFAACIRC